MNVVFGIDAGGSKTCVRMTCADSGNLVEERTIAGLGMAVDAPNRALPELENLLRNLQRGHEAATLAVCANLGGKNVDQLQRALKRACPEARCCIFGEPSGVVARHIADKCDAQAVLLAGTGAIATAWDATTDRQIVCGGWGPDIGDQGSGYWIGMEALKTAFAALDGCGEWTALCGSLLQEPQPLSVHADLAVLIRQRDLIRERLFPLSRAQVAALTPAVTACAVQGDAVAASILRRAGEALAQPVIAAVIRVGLRDRPGMVLVLGGLRFTADWWSEAFTEQLNEGLPGWRWKLADCTLAHGAAHMALDMAGRDFVFDAAERETHMSEIIQT